MAHLRSDESGILDLVVLILVGSLAVLFIFPNLTGFSVFNVSQTTRNLLGILFFLLAIFLILKKKKSKKKLKKK